MSGAAAVCSASVTSTVARVDPRRSARRCSASAAATIRLLASSPIATTASCERGDTSRSTASACTQAAQLVELASQRLRQSRRPLLRSSAPARSPMCRSSSSPASAAAALGRRRLRRARAVANQAVGHPTAPTRRRPAACRRRLRLPLPPDDADRRASIASASATDVPPNFITTHHGARCTGLIDRSQQPLAVHQLGVQNRRAGGAADRVVAERDELVVEHRTAAAAGRR